jgi:hypothetical protein
MPRALGFLTLALLAAGPLAADSVVLFLDPASTPVEVGNSVDIRVDISGLGDPPALGSYDLTVEYNSALFSFTSVVFGDPILGDQLNLSSPPFGTISSFSPGSGTVEFNEASLDSPSTLDTLQAPAFVLATLQFQAIGQGTGAFSFDAPDVFLGDAIGNSLSASLGAAQVQVDAATAAPEPYMFWPILAVLAALQFRKSYALRRNCIRVRSPRLVAS